MQKSIDDEPRDFANTARALNGIKRVVCDTVGDPLKDIADRLESDDQGGKPCHLIAAPVIVSG
jgi:hypothetical protein